MDARQFIGKKFKYKLVDGEPKTVIDIKNDNGTDIVVFSDNGRVPLNRFAELFAEATDNRMPIQEAKKILLSEDQPDPADFFNKPSPSLVNQIKSAAEKIDISKMPEQIVSNVRNPHQDLLEPEGPVRKIMAERDDSGKVVSHVEEVVQNGHVVSSSANNGIDFFKKMKRNQEAKLNLSWVEKIPNFEFIKMMDDNMDQGILDYLVTDITERIMASPNILQKQVREQLNTLIYNSKPVKKKPVATKRKKVEKEKA